MVDVAELQSAITNEIGRALAHREAYGRVSVHLPSLDPLEWPPNSHELSGELFISAHRFSGVGDEDLRRLLGAVQAALASRALLPDQIARAEIHQNGPIFNERHANLGDVRTLAATLIVEHVRDSVRIVGSSTV